jgi:hypothetical protein
VDSVIEATPWAERVGALVGKLAQDVTDTAGVQDELAREITKTSAPPGSPSNPASSVTSERDRLRPAPKSCSMPPVSSSSQPKFSELATACSDAAVTTPRVSASAAYAKSRSSSLGAVALGFSACAAGHWSARLR